ncbi:MAG: 50S ribosomal protein L32 [Oscillospiraceae bacterium]|jgi:large subunit ribosomal protein L32|nr:50S ribosomal protein L32 [Oscillospiraceae bacterium]MBO7727783.1 50S ribosomal protein L32 [Oscillospiraceae bacterium]MBP3208791.1 50S ribosomal protein L32 [Oscillospiraceae bacterium]MBP5167894.1 50S ribosomal protein L32 [Oscillospiraceae bacterium]MBQ1403409.1 50S ribosomal protein L32 [Oscillospiraceae bacterium]
MAVPKGKVSRQRRDKRRSSTWKLTAPALVKCPNCGAFVMPHRVCKACGKYNGRQVLTVEEE